MSVDNRPQYQPTPELQNLLNTLSPAINQNVGIDAHNWRLISFSNYEENPNRFTFFVEGSDKRYKLELEQEIRSGTPLIKILKIFEIITK